ncbi:hypothetical protein KR009_011216, partial [Drosophila setifemur]
MDNSVLEWKKVNLFNISALPPLKCPKPSEITCHCYNLAKSNIDDRKITIVFCDKNGNIIVYFSKLEYIAFKCQPKRDTIKLCALTSTNLLATASQNENYGMHIDLYDLRKLSKKHGAPLISTSYFDSTSTATCINAEAIDGKTLALGIGFQNGDVLLHYGKINRLLSANIRRHTITNQSIIGIHFDSNALQTDTQDLNMFVTCIYGVFCFTLKEKGQIEQKFRIDNEKKESNHCCTMRKAGDEEFEESMLVVGAENAVYCYTRDGRGPCFAIDGKKKCLAWVGQYLIVVVNPRNSLPLENKSTLIVVDTDSKIIVFYKQIQNFICPISENEVCYILSTTDVADTCNVFMLQQHNMKSRIRLLIEKSMYDIALKMLHREGYSSSPDAAFVRFQYGNHLLQKGDVSRAVKEYIKTIGFIKPYDVISKLLYSRYNEHLKDYLSELAKSDTNSIHCNKLIGLCLARQNLENKIDEVTVQKKSFVSEDDRDLKQLSNLFVPRNENDHFEETLNNFLEYETGTLLVDPNIYLKNVRSESVDIVAENVCFLFSILSEYNEYCVDLLTNMIEKFPSCDERVYLYLLIVYLGLWHSGKISSQLVLDFLKNYNAPLDKALLICKLYSFLCGIKEIEIRQQNAKTEPPGNRSVKSLIDKTELSLNLNKRSFLMLLKSACNGSIMAEQIKPVFLKEVGHRIVDSSEEIRIIDYFNERNKKSRCLIGLFTHNPIEFRNDTCDICRQTLNTQSIYFLCQHSFHKECLNYNRTKSKDLKCIVCSVNMNDKPDEKPEQIDNSDSPDIIAAIAQVIATG